MKRVQVTLLTSSHWPSVEVITIYIYFLQEKSASLMANDFLRQSFSFSLPFTLTRLLHFYSQFLTSCFVSSFVSLSLTLSFAHSLEFSLLSLFLATCSSCHLTFARCWPLPRLLCSSGQSDTHFRWTRADCFVLESSLLLSLGSFVLSLACFSRPQYSLFKHICFHSLMRRSFFFHWFFE